MDQLMFPLYFYYENVSHQDQLLKPNHANVMEVPGSCKIIVVPKTTPSIKNEKLAMEIPCCQKLIQTQKASTGKSFRSNPFLGSNKLCPPPLSCSNPEATSFPLELRSKLQPFIVAFRPSCIPPYVFCKNESHGLSGQTKPEGSYPNRKGGTRRGPDSHTKHRRDVANLAFLARYVKPP